MTNSVLRVSAPDEPTGWGVVRHRGDGDVPGCHTAVAGRAVRRRPPAGVRGVRRGCDRDRERNRGAGLRWSRPSAGSGCGGVRSTGGSRRPWARSRCGLRAFSGRGGRSRGSGCQGHGTSDRHQRPAPGAAPGNGA